MAVFERLNQELDESREGICDWGCGREGPLVEICLDGRIYDVCPRCANELEERYTEDETKSDWAILRDARERKTPVAE